MIKEGIGVTLFLTNPILFTRTDITLNGRTRNIYFFLFFFAFYAFLHLHEKKKSNACVNFFSLRDGWLLSVMLESNLEVRIVLLWLSSKLIKRCYPKVWKPFSRQTKKRTISENRGRVNEKLQTHVWKQLQLHASQREICDVPELWDTIGPALYTKPSLRFKQCFLWDH